MSDDIAGVGIRVETDGITGGIKALDALADQGPKVEKSLQGVEASAAKTGKSIASLGQGGAETGLARVAKSGGEAAAGITKVGGASTMAAAAAKKASEEAAASISTIGMSAKQTAAALRGVPAQFTDIITALQGGQAPLTVFLQQGGQLKDMFGGAGNAARALGGYVVGLINPFTLAAGAAAALTAGYFAGAEEAQEYARSMLLSGNAAGVTAGELQRLAAAQDQLAGTQGEAAAVLAQLVASGRVARDVLAGAADAAIRLERAGGTAAEETVKKLAQLGKEPVAALLKLDEAEGFLTASLYKRVKALQESGQAQEAARVAQEGYLSSLNGRTAELEQNLGTIERGWRGLKDTAKEAWDAMLGIGRPSVLETQIAGLRADAQRLRAAQNNQAIAGFRETARAALGGPSLGQQADELDRIIERLQQSADLGNGIAKANADALSAEREKVRLAETNAGWLQKSARLAKELADAQTEGEKRIAAGLITRQDLEAKLADIRGRYAGGKSDSAAQREREQQLEREAVALEKLRGLSGTYFRDLSLLQQLRAKDLLTEQEYLKAYEALARQQPINVQLEKQQAEARKASAAALKALLEADAKYLDGLSRNAATAEEQLQRLRDEEQAAKIAATGNVTLAQAIQMVGMARIEEAKAAATARGEYDTAAALERELAARRELITLIGSSEARKASTDAAREAEREWIRTAQRIEDSLTDALMRGFESGKDFGRNLRDSLVNLFKTLVLRPIIQPIAGALAGGATSLLGGLLGGLGLSGSAVAGGLGGGNLTNAALQAGGLLNYGGLGIAGSAAGSTLAGLMGFGELSTLTIAEAIKGGFAALSSGSIAGGLGTLLGAAAPFLGGAALIGNALGLFRSTKTVGSGVTGDLGGTIQDFEVRRKGGSLFSGPSYSTPTIGVSNLNADLQATFAALRNTAAGFASTLGLDAEAARRFVTPIGSEKLSDDTGGLGIRLEGLNADEVAKKIEAELKAANERLAAAVLGSAADAFTRTGETASQTLERLAGSLQGVNGVLDALGQAALQASAQGGAYASALLDQFGSLQQFQSAAGQYLQDYYSQAERSALATQGLSQQLGSLGLSVPASRDAYRQLVEAQDLSTESGRKAYAVLLQLAPTFAELVPAVEELGQSAQEAARLAKEAAERQAEAGRRVLESLGRDAAQLQADLLEAQGDTAGATRLRRNAELAELLEGLNAADTAAATAAFNLNSALRDQIAATEEAARKAHAFQDALSGLGDSRFDLEQQLRRLNGQDAQAAEAQRLRDLARLTAGMTAEQAAQIAAAYDYNLSLQAQVKATEDAQRAAEQLAADQTKAADQAQQAAERIRDSWKSVTDSLFEEAARIRGLITGSSPQGFASAQAQFAMTTAQARAGDQEAAKLLPGLSQTLLQLAEANATSLVDLKRIRAQIAASLEQTGSSLAGSYGLNIPKLATGTNLVPKDMLALLHEGEAVVPRAFNPAAGGGEAGSAQVVAELRAVQAELREMRARLDAVNRNTGRVASAVEGNQSTPILVELAQ